MRRSGAFVAALAVLAAPAAAQNLVTSARADSVAVTVYRDPERDPARTLNLRWLNGYSLISETRTVTLPAGESVIRFEGVASGAFAETAIVTGFPDGIVERNRDAELLSAATLLDRSLARRVHLRRTSLATGAVREEEAVIRSGADGAVVLQTADGFEALRCTGLPETLVYDGIPAGLSARPTLSVRLRSGAPVTATVTLSYLAGGFDWQANYVGTLSPDGRRLALFAWLTLASMDETSFPDANTQAVAGQPNREPPEWQPREATGLQLRCWPQRRTHEVRPGGEGYDSEDQAIVVTGTRVAGANVSALQAPAMEATQEALGDLKLYRIPAPVTVSSHSQKQVALLHRSGVAVREVYRAEIERGEAGRDPEPAQWLLLTRNRTADGLGLPLPAGRMVLFGAGAARPLMLGAAAIGDHAVGEDVEFQFGNAIGVMTALRRISSGKDRTTYDLIVTNDHPRRIEFEARLTFGDIRAGARLGTRNGTPLWRVTVPANGRAVLRFSAAGGN
jgi:hypothetical protein